MTWCTETAGWRGHVSLSLWSAVFNLLLDSSTLHWKLCVMFLQHLQPLLQVFRRVHLLLIVLQQCGVSQQATALLQLQIICAQAVADLSGSCQHFTLKSHQCVCLGQLSVFGLILHLHEMKLLFHMGNALMVRVKKWAL